MGSLNHRNSTRARRRRRPQSQANPSRKDQRRNAAPPDLQALLRALRVAIALVRVAHQSLHAQDIADPEEDTLGVALEHLDRVYDLIDHAGIAQRRASR